MSDTYRYHPFRTSFGVNPETVTSGPHGTGLNSFSPQVVDNVHHLHFGGVVPPSEAPESGAPGAGPRASGATADARGPLRRAIERVLVVAFGTAVVAIGFVVGAAVAVFALAVFVAWATLYAAWVLRFPILGGTIAGLIYAAGWF